MIYMTRLENNTCHQLDTLTQTHLLPLFSYPKATHTRELKNHTPPPIFMLILLVNTSRPPCPLGRSRVGCLFLLHPHLLPSISHSSLLHTFFSIFVYSLWPPSLIFPPFCASIQTHLLCVHQPLYYFSPSQPLLPSAPPTGVSAACRSCCYGDRSYLHSVPLASPAPGV